MRITTLAKNYFFHCVLLLTLLGQNSFVYSQCPTVTNANQSFCDTQSPTISSLQAIDNGGGVKWYPTATSTAALSNSSVLVNGQDYFADDNTGNCGPRQSVIVTIYSAPTGANFQGVCVTSLSQATPSNPQFVIIGNNLQWYTTPSGGTALSPTAILTDNTIYYISQTNPDTGCQTSRLSVFVNVGLVPPPTGNAVQEFCNIPGNPPTVGDLVASGTNNWYLTSAFGIPLDSSTPLVNGQFYYATTVDPPCESSDRLEVLVNIYELNDAGNDGGRSICVDEIPVTTPFDLYNLIGGTPDNTGVWSGPIATTNGSQGTLDVSSMTLAGSPYVFTYTVSSALCVPDASTVIITILPLPTVSVAVSPTTICANESATFTLTGTPNATVTYNINGGANQTITLNASGTATITGTYTTNTTVNIISVSSSGTPSCVYPQVSSTTLTVVDTPIAGVNANTTICILNSSFDLFPLLGPTAQVGGTWSPALDSGTGVFNPSVDVAGTYTYTLSGTVPCQPTSATVQVTVNPVPDAGNDGALNICSNQNSVDLFASLSGTPQLGGTWSPALASGTGIFNPAVDVSGVYTYTVTGIAPCVDDTSTVTVTVTPGPEAGTNNSVTLCVNSTAQDLALLLGPNSQPGGTWLPAMASGTGVFDPAIDAAGDYTYTLTGTQPCDNDFAVITVTVNQVPNAGDDNSVALCFNDIAQDLFLLLGANAQVGGTWSPALASGTGFFNPVVDVAGTYTYSIGGGLCAIDTAEVVTTIILAPNSGGVGQTLNTCVSSTSIDLFTGLDGTQGTGTWNDDDATGALAGNVFNPSTSGVGTYHFTYTVVGTSPCANATSTVTVIVNPLPVAGINNTLTLCSSDPAQDLFGLLGNTAEPGGTWSPALTSGTGVFNPAIDTTNTYTYTVTSTFCPSASASVNVTVIPAANSGGIGLTLNTCINVISLDLFTGLDGTQNTGGTWNDDDASGALTGNIFNPSGVAVGTYHFTYTVLGTTPCPNSTSTVTVIVDPLPNAGNDNTLIICSTGAVQDLFLLLGPNAQPGGTWSPALTSGTGVFNPTTDLAGTYTYSVGGSPCPTDTANVVITIIQSPVISTINITISPACLGSNLVVSLNGMVDGTYTLAYDLTGTNTLAGQTATVTIVAGIGNFSIPAASLPNIGTTVITFSNILNTVTNCSNILIGVATQIIVRPLAEIDSANLSATAVCLGNNITINVTNAINLPDGVYQFNYSIPGADPTNSNSGNVTIAVGVGQFTVPATLFTTAGNYTLTIFGIIAQTGCTNANESASVSFTINPIPDLNTATLTVQETCANYATQATITGTVNMPDGDYTILYILSGANSASNTVTVTFSGGTGTFTVPASDLVNNGTTALTISQLNSVTTTCGVIGNVIMTTNFDVTQLGTPQIIQDGNLFCEDDNPTIESLTANLVGFPTVIWYNAPSGGTAYSNTDLLVQGTTYYAALTAASGCEGSVRLEVLVDLTVCDDILIPDGYSPNNDGINDTFEIENLAILYPNFKLEIYNRYGNLIYTGNRNTPNWDGTTTAGGLNLGNNLLPTGVYFYILNFNDGLRKAVQGRVYLNR